MKASSEDRLDDSSGGRGFRTRHVVLAALVVAVLAFLWATRGGRQEPPPETGAVVGEAVVEESPLPAAPDIPVRTAPTPPPPVAQKPAEAQPEPALPPLAESDSLVREELDAAKLGPELESVRESSNLVQNSAALIDSLSRGIVLRKLVPLAPPEGAFAVELVDGEMYVGPEGYHRYDDYAEAIEGLDTAALVNSFDLLRPLYEQAYAQLGLPAEDFDNAVIRTLDRILATPEIEQPIALERKSVMYTYADPQLEKLSPLQKQLLRMGPENIRRIKAQAKALRDALLTPR